MADWLIDGKDVFSLKKSRTFNVRHAQVIGKIVAIAVIRMDILIHIDLVLETNTLVVAKYAYLSLLNTGALNSATKSQPAPCCRLSLPLAM